MLTLVAFVALAQTVFVLPKLEAYDPADLGGVKFGMTADKDLKKMFKVGKGAMRPEALVIGQDDQWRYDALLNGRGGDAKAIAVWAEARKAVEVRDLAGAIGEPERLFARDRSSDWSVLTYPERGLALFATRQGSREFVDGVLLTDKGFITQLVRNLESEETRILDLREIFDRKDRRVLVRSFDVSLTRKNINIGEVSREERLLESFAERRAESRNIRFGNGEGRISVSVQIDFEKTSVSASVSGSNEVGAVSGSGSATARKFSVRNDVAEYRRAYVEDAVLDALQDALDAAERAIQAQRPSTEAEDRKRVMYGVINAGIR